MLSLRRAALNKQDRKVLWQKSLKVQIFRYHTKAILNHSKYFLYFLIVILELLSYLIYPV